MRKSNRREFLGDVGRGMLIASVGTALATDLGLSPALAGDESATLSFGKMDPLVALMEQTPIQKLLPLLMQ
jgi:hypothetical protein